MKSQRCTASSKSRALPMLSREMVAYPKYALQHPTLTARSIFTAHTSPPGSHPEQTKCVLSAHSHDGRTVAQFAVVYPSASPGLEARQTIPKHLRTASSARSHGIWNRYRNLAVGAV